MSFSDAVAIVLTVWAVISLLVTVLHFVKENRDYKKHQLINKRNLCKVKFLYVVVAMKERSKQINWWSLP